MGRVRPTVAAGTHATGFAQKLAIIEGIDETNHVATVKDKLGYRHTIRTDVMAAKGVAPVVGETWIIDRTHGTWSFLAIVGYTHITAATVVPTLPVAGPDSRGQIVIVFGGPGVADHVYICVKNASDAYAWIAVTP